MAIMFGILYAGLLAVLVWKYFHIAPRPTFWTREARLSLGIGFFVCILLSLIFKTNLVRSLAFFFLFYLMLGLKRFLK